MNVTIDEKYVTHMQICEVHSGNPCRCGLMEAMTTPDEDALLDSLFSLDGEKMTAAASGDMDSLFQLLRDLDIKQLNDLISEADRQQDRLSADIVGSLKLGDTIKIANSVRPKYLAGAEGVIEKFKTKNVGVRMPVDSSLRRYSGTLLTLPPALIIA